MSGPSFVTFREMTVADLREALAEMPDHYPVVPIVNGMAGVITDVWMQPVGPHGSVLSVLIGEKEWSPQTVPSEWTEDVRGEAFVHRADMDDDDKRPVCAVYKYAGHDGPCRGEDR